MADINDNERKTDPQNKQRKEGFLHSKVFAVLLSVIITALVMSLIGWYAFVVSPEIGEEKEDTEEDVADTVEPGVLSVSNIDFDPTGKSGYNITFVFNNDVVKEDTIGKDIEEKQFFTFEPKISEGGVYVWETPNRLKFKPNSPLLPSTVYTATMQKEEFDAWKGDITEKSKYEIETVRFKVLNVSGNTIKDIDDKDIVKYKYNIFFNMPVLPKDVEKHTKLMLDNEEIGYTIQDIDKESEASTEITLITERIKKQDYVQYLYLTINEDIKCLSCTLGMEEVFKDTTRINEKEYLIIYDIADFTRKINNEYKHYIRLSLSHQVDVDEIKPYISIKPEMDFTLAGGNFYLDIYGDFESYETYTITLNKGYESIYGATVKETIERTINIRALDPDIELQSPSMGFTSPGVYLPKEQSQEISVNTINVDKIDVRIMKIFSNNLVYYLQENHSYSSYDDYYYYYDDIADKTGKEIYKNVIDVNDTDNMRVYSEVNLKDFLAQEKKGIYRITVRDNDYRWRSSTKWIVATDLGIVAKNSGRDLLVWINSMKSLRPQPFVNVKLLSYTNQVIAEGKTDRNGLLKINNIRELTEEYKSYVVVAETEEDFSFVRLDSETKLSTVDFDVNGSHIPDEGIEAYLYMDRDIFRPGDSANMVAAVRSIRPQKLSTIPVKLKITNPKSQVTHELKGNLNENGLVEFNFDISSYFMTGYYNARLMMGDGNVIGSYRFQVEAFMPATIEVEVETDKNRYAPGETIEAKVNGMSLYGPPAADKKVQARFSLNSAKFNPSGYRSYHFGDYSKSFSSYTNSLGEFRLDEEGNYTYNIDIRENVNPPSILKGTIYASVFDTGGRAVTEAKSVDIYPYEYYIGIKRGTDYYVKTEVPVPFDYVVLNKDAEEVEVEQIQVQVKKYYWVNILKRQSNGQLKYVSERREDIIETTVLKDFTKPYIYTPTSNGSFKVTFTIPGSKTSSSLDFYAYGWGGDSFSLAEPNKLLLELDKTSYETGDIANVIVKSPFAGKLLLTVEREEVLFQHVVDMDENTANIKLRIEEEYGPNAYISGTLIRSIDYAEPFTPVRAFGLVPLKVDDPETTIDMDVNAPDKMEPNNRISIDVNINDTISDKANLTVAAVDEGILLLTDYKNPDPHGYFYRKRALTVNTYDLYNFIIPDEDKVKQIYSNPGGAEDGRASSDYLSKSNVERVKPVSLWSGIVDIVDNKATITMDIPEFNGTLRIMAVAVDDESYGTASTKTIVRAPIVLSPTFPRFLSIQDSYKIPVGVYNDTGSDGEITVSLSDNGYTEIEEPTKTIFVKEGKEEIIYFNVKSKNKIGDVYFTLKAEGNGRSAVKEIEMEQRSFRSRITEVTTGVIRPDEAINLDVAEGWLEDATDYSLKISSLPTVKFTNSLKYLLRYPYGCAEQTTSKVFPLLYFSDLAETAEPKLMNNRSAAYYVERGIRKLESMQLSDGSIAYWPNGNYTNEWSSIYAGHFLIEAKKAGYQVSDRVIKDLVGWLKTVVNRAYTVDESKYRYYNNELDKKSYAHYVLALANEPQLASMFYIKNNLLGDINYLSKYYMMGAFALAGLTDLKNELMQKTYEVPDIETNTGGNFYSSTRTIAIMLNVLAEIDSDNILIPKLIEELEDRAYNGRWYNTQENSYALLALGKVFSKKKDDNYTVNIIDKRQGRLGSYQSGEKALNIELGYNSELELSLDGTGEAYYTLSIFGIPDRDVEEYDKGLKIRRTYLDATGEPVDLSDVKTGQLLVAKINIRSAKHLENVAIVDLLPAGFEIENPRLSTSEELNWAQSTYNADYMDIRDDRLLMFSDVRANYDRTFYYTVRAVTPGSFRVPAIMAEAMYNPDYSSLSSTGSLNISE
ncbi:MAG: alpha-2-macroglobulin family protein [Spirochaetota bacterium]